MCHVMTRLREREAVADALRAEQQRVDQVVGRRARARERRLARVEEVTKPVEPVITEERREVLLLLLLSLGLGLGLAVVSGGARRARGGGGGSRAALRRRRAASTGFKQQVGEVAERVARVLLADEVEPDEQLRGFGLVCFACLCCGSAPQSAGREGGSAVIRAARA